ncbi:tyrosine-type recombinase/integrase [Georgenia ruanii]|nr:site-specific integrase [Georgenia ruanii]MPV87290.1 integrase [Georgenia ruanii]
MRRVVIDRAVVAAAPPRGDLPWDPQAVNHLLDRLELPDGFPFLIEDDGQLATVWATNQYLLAAWSQGAYTLKSLARFHSYHLWRLLRFLRARRAHQRAREAALPVEEWLATHPEPRVDLTDATAEDLVAYRDARRAEVRASSWNTELASVSGFYDWALAAHLIERSPIPRWGQRRRNTLAARERLVREPRFLTETQLRLFLERGLRCDGDPTPTANRERDYTYGLTLATMGLRREEAALLLDCEIPRTPDMPTAGVWPFTLVGKGSRPRTVFVTDTLADATDLYRRVERDKAVAAAQPRLRRLREERRLLLCDAIEHDADGKPVIKIGTRRIRAELLSDAQRKTAALITDRGTIEPLALFTSRLGTPVDLRRWNAVFDESRRRVHHLNNPDRPPQHLTVTPHVFRHTYAVRMLSALMRLGRRTAEDPYLLLANPVLTVMELLGHADVETTQKYLYAADRYTDELPEALRHISAATMGHTVAPTKDEKP